MKTIKITILLSGLAILLCCISTLVSCESQSPRDSSVGQILRGKHELRKFKTVTEEGYQMSGSYFLIAGSMKGGTYKDNKVAFSFQLPDSTYAMAELPFGDIRVRIDSTIEKPYVTFHWNSGGNASDMEWVMSYYVNYMVVHCKEEDFPYEVNITDL